MANTVLVKPRLPQAPKEWVAVILSLGLALAINIISITAMFVAISNYGEPQGGLSENATQLLTAAFGGIIGVLGSYVGYRAGARQRENDQASDEPKDDE